MIRAVDNYPISQLFDIEGNFLYYVPRYQREYIWNKVHWDRLFDDLLENDAGYFLGSIICINQQTDAIAVQELEVVDGQQRLTTLSLLFSATYDALKNLQSEGDEDLLVTRNNIKRKLVLKNTVDRLRTIPQIQNNNLDDYRAVLAEVGVVPHVDAPNYAGNRKMFKAFRHFQRRLAEHVAKSTDARKVLLDFVDKINRASLVKIEVASHTDAYILFESLNDRGVPLTAVDLIKNKLLAQIEREDAGKVDYYYDQWQGLLKDLGEKYAIHERFFRHYYNAFKEDLKEVVNVPLASKSNLIFIYERLINNDARKCLTDTAAASKIYAFITSNRRNESLRDLSQPLKDLERIQGAPSYVLLLNLLAKSHEYELTTGHLREIIETLVRFFVRRNLTDSPATNEVTRVPMRILDRIRYLTGQEIVDNIKQELASISSTDAEFKRRLNGNIYDENEAVARFILIALAEESMTRETYTDLWEQHNGQWVWSIEHIFPQGENIPESWVSMIGEGDMDKARKYQQEYVHRLGNLTITGYNSSLGNKSFEEKRDRVNDRHLPIGYKNGLGLNEELAEASHWSVDQIITRGNRMVENALELFRLEGVPE